MRLIVPFNNSPMYWGRPGVARRPGRGPSGFGRDVSPFPFATRSVLPSLETRTLVGYQPTGMKPRLRDLPGELTSKTATVLMLAFATKSRSPFGLKAREFGVFPGGAFGWSSARSVSTE